MLFRRAFVLAAALAASAASAQNYDVTMNPAASTATWSFSLNAPFQTGGVSHILGNYHITDNPTGTRTLPGLFGSDNGLNNPIPINSGSVSADASSGSTALHPASSFAISLNTGAGTCAISGFSADILNGTTASTTANVSISFSSFRTRQPTCTIFGIPLNLPLGEIVVTSLIATQDSASAPGTLTPAGGGSYNFSVPMTALATVTATLDGEDFPVDPFPIAFVLGGTITPSGGTATVSATIAIDQDDSQPGTALDPLPFTEPLCSGNLIFNITLASVNTSTIINASLNGTGTAPPPQCDGDVNCDGNLDGFDVEVMERATGGDMADFCQPDPDFNHDGNLDGFDVEAVELVTGGGPCP